MKIKKIFIIIALILVIVSVSNYSFASVNESDLNITSESALLIEPSTGKILYGKNEKERRFPASTTKILTAILTIENCNLEDKVIVDYDSIAMVPSGYSVATLQVGEELTIKQLLQVLLIHSANDAANVLAKHVSGSIDSFATMMNAKAYEIGCKDSHFLNPSGKHDDNHYTTAYDLALIMNYCMKNSTFKELASSKSCVIPQTNKYEERIFTNTNELLKKDTREIESNYYYPYAVAGKTGYTAQAKNCLVSVASKDNLDLICVILGAGQTSNGLSARFLETKKIFEYGYNTYTTKKLRQKGAIAKQIEIPNATKETKNLDLLLTNDITTLVKQEKMNDEIEPEIILNDNLSAPIEQGATIGKIKYNVEGIDYTSDLIASHSVEKSSFVLIVVRIILIAFILFILYKLLSSNKKRKYKRA